MKFEKMMALVIGLWLMCCGVQLRGEPAIFEAIKNKNFEKAMELVDQESFDPNIQHSGESNSLHYIAQLGSPSKDDISKSKILIDKLIQKGANVDAKNSLGRTPFHAAIDEINFDIALYLLEGGANCNTRDVMKSTPLHKAVEKLTDEFLDLYKNDIEKAKVFSDEGKKMIDALLRKGASIDVKDSTGLTPFGRVKDWEQVKPIRKLLEECYIKAGKQKVCLTKYKTKDDKDFKCKRVAIFINDDPSENMDPVFNEFKKSIDQRSAPVIVSRPILHLFFSTQSVDALLENWLIYSRNGMGDDPYYLLIPKIAVTDFSEPGAGLLKLGFDDALKLCSFSVVVDISDKKEDLEEKEGDFFKKNESFFKTESGPWNIYLTGHGMQDISIAGMSKATFEQFLDFLSKEISTLFLFYVTCYGGGTNLVEPYRTRFSSSININFTVAQAAVTESSVLSLAVYDPFCPNANFKTFFGALEDIFSNEPRSLLKWDEVFKSVINMKGYHLTSNAPLIRFPGIDFFQAHAISENVDILTQTRCKVKMLEEDASINVDDGKVVLLLYPPVIPIPLHLPLKNSRRNEEFKIISMNPEPALHFFKEIRGKNFESYEESLINLFRLDRGFLGSKVFIIKKWNFDNGYEFSNIVMSMHPLSYHGNVYGIVIWLKIEKTPQTENIGKCMIRKYEYKDGYMHGAEKGFERISSDQMQFGVTTVLEGDSFRYDNLRGVRKPLVAPWQEEPDVLAGFVKQELFNVDKDPEKSLELKISAILQEKIDAMKIRFFYDEAAVKKMKEMIKKRRELRHAEANEGRQLAVPQ